MKVLYISIAVIFTAFVIVQLFALKDQSSIETYTYQTLEKNDSFEIRRYDDALFTSVKLSTKGFKNSASKGFSVLAGYIFGANSRNEKIAMTSPVSMSLEDSMTMMFLVPKSFKKEQLPLPDHSEIKFKKEPAKTVAAIRFGGWANAKRIKKYKEQLTAALNLKGIVHTNKFYFLGYNPPYEVFNRKNEIIVELEYNEQSQF